MARVLVTGANGHIGSHVVRVLLARGYEAVSFVRLTSDLRSIHGVEVERRVGDVLDHASLERAMRGCDYVIHTASTTSVSKPQADLVTPPVTAAQNVFAAAASAGVRRLVCTSSAVAAGRSLTASELRDENDWGESAPRPYDRAKVAAERAAFACASRHGLEHISILPTQVLGALDYRTTPPMRMAADLLSASLPTLEGGTNLVSVRDVAFAHVSALERGRPGERYLIGGENLTLRKVGALATELTGVTLRHLQLPRWAMSGVATMMVLRAKISGHTPLMTRAFVLDTLHRYAWFDCSKAEAELELRPAPARRVMREAAAWLLARGHLEKSAARAIEQRLARHAEAEDVSTAA